MARRQAWLGNELLVYLEGYSWPESTLTTTWEAHGSYESQLNRPQTPSASQSGAGGSSRGSEHPPVDPWTGHLPCTFCELRSRLFFGVF